MIDGNQLREEFGRYLAEHKATRWGMDAALMHVCKIAYDAGKADGRAEPERGAVPEGDDGKRVLREVFALCEDTEAKCYEDPSDFSRGRAFEAKGIARAIGAWYQEEFCGRTHMGEPAAPAPDQFRDAAKMVASSLWPTDGVYPDMQPPATQRDRWMFDQGRLAERRIATAAAPAEVPMPEPVGWYVSGSDPEHAALWLECPDDEQMQVMNQQCDDGPVTARPVVLGADAERYGDAREAAGYARGLKEAGRDAERLQWMQFHGARVEWSRDDEYCCVAWADRSDTYRTALFSDWRDAIDAALRGEVKP